MRLKSFYAKTVTEAMQMVRDMLGEDAIIVATREEKGGKAVCVTAAIEPGFENGSYRDHFADAPNFEIGEEEHRNAGSGWLQYDDEDEEYAVTEEITEAMLKHGVPEDVLDHIISCATVIGLEQPSVALVAALEHLYSFTPMPRKAARKPYILMGPPGAGKTLAVAKLAARGVMDGLKVGVITTDTVRAGGVEQLSAFTKLLQIDLKKARNTEALRDILADLRAQRYDQIYVDTQGINPFNREDIKQAAMLLGSADMEGVLVMPGGLDAEESGEIARAFASLNIHQMMATRTDMARRLGGILSAASHGGMSFTDAGNTPKVADGLISMTPQSLARLLMPSSYRGDSRSSVAGSGKSHVKPRSSSPSTSSEKRKSVKQ